MSMKSSLITYLRAQSAVTDIVSQRVRLNRAEQSDTSRVLIHQIGGDHKQHMTAATGKVIGRFQIDSDDTSPIKAATLAEAVRTVLDGFRGTMGSVFVSMCHLDDERDVSTPPIEGQGASNIYTVQQDYLIGWSVSIPSFA